MAYPRQTADTLGAQDPNTCSGQSAGPVLLSITQNCLPVQSTLSYPNLATILKERLYDPHFTGDRNRVM